MFVFGKNVVIKMRNERWLLVMSLDDKTQRQNGVLLCMMFVYKTLDHVQIYFEPLDRMGSTFHL